MKTISLVWIGPEPHWLGPVRRSCILKNGGYPDVAAAEDFALWTLCAQSGARFANVREAIIYKRNHSSMASSVNVAAMYASVHRSVKSMNNAVVLPEESVCQQISTMVRDDIPRAIIGRLKLKHICEVGVRACVFTRTLLSADIAELVAVDIWRDTGVASQNDDGRAQTELDRQYAEAMQLSAQDCRLRVIREFSNVAAKAFDDSYFDLVYIDADHTYEGVKSDLLAWWPKVRKGGILSGHDFCEITVAGGRIVFGVVRAVKEFAAIHNKQVYVTKDAYSPSWFILK